MAWTNLLHRRTDRTRTSWGYTFELTDDHLTPEQYEPLRQSYDSLGEQVLDRLNHISPAARRHDPRGNSRADDGEKHEPPAKPPARDLYAILKENVDEDDLLRRFWDEVTAVPDWVDWEQIRRGQDVFYRYGGANLTGLAYMSLLGGFGAAKVVETLARTGGFSTKVARGRLFETTQFILQCTRSIESLQPGGDGFASTIRVRLLHAAVRQRILKLAETRPEYYDVNAWGVPINDLDSISTIASFSSTLIWLALPRQGIFLRQQEIVDYVALWRYIAHVIGCPTDGFFDTPAHARRTLEVILLYEIQPSATSRIMANNMIKSLEGQPPNYASADFLIASARWMNGNALCDALGLARPSAYYWALMAGQCTFFCFWSYTYRHVPSWDRNKIEMLKKLFYNIIVHSKYGLNGEESTFELKYIPEYSTITQMGESEEKRANHSDVETRNLKSFIIAVGVLGVVAWTSAVAAGAVWRRVF